MCVAIPAAADPLVHGMLDKLGLCWGCSQQLQLHQAILSAAAHGVIASFANLTDFKVKAKYGAP